MEQSLSKFGLQLGNMRASFEEHVIQPPQPTDEEPEAQMGSLRGLPVRSKTGATSQAPLRPSILNKPHSKQ